MTNGEQNESWIAFAIVMAMMAGSVNVIFGITALITKAGLPESSVAHLTLQQWGWALLIFGVIQFVLAMVLAARKNWGRILAIVLAAVSFIVWVPWVGALPLAGIAALVFDVLIIYGLSVTRESFS